MYGGRSRSASRCHCKSGFFAFCIGFLIRIVDTIAVGVSLKDASRILHRIVMVASIVALHLMLVVLQSLLLVVRGFLAVALDFLGLQNLLFFYKPCDFRGVGLINTD